MRLGGTLEDRGVGEVLSTEVIYRLTGGSPSAARDHFGQSRHETGFARGLQEIRTAQIATHGFGTSSAETGLVWQRIFEFINYARDLIDDGVARPLIRGEAVKMGDNVKASASKVHAALGWMEGVLARNSFLAGEGLTAADVSAIPNIQFLARVGKHADARSLGLGFEDLSGAYPCVARWIGRIENLPSYDAAYPPHWRPT